MNDFSRRTMRRLRASIPVIALTLVITGCFPMRFTVRPGVSGVVYDNQTGALLVGAEVFFSKAPYTFYHFTNQTVEGVTAEATTPPPPPQPPSLDAAIRNASPPVVFTDVTGWFAIPPAKKWGLYIVPMDYFPPRPTLVIRAEGYDPELRLVSSPSTAELDVPMNKTN